MCSRPRRDWTARSRSVFISFPWQPSKIDTKKPIPVTSNTHTLGTAAAAAAASPRALRACVLERRNRVNYYLRLHFLLAFSFSLFSFLFLPALHERTDGRTGCAIVDSTNRSATRLTTTTHARQQQQQHHPHPRHLIDKLSVSGLIGKKN